MTTIYFVQSFNSEFTAQFMVDSYQSLLSGYDPNIVRRGQFVYVIFDVLSTETTLSELKDLLDIPGTLELMEILSFSDDVWPVRDILQMVKQLGGSIKRTHSRSHRYRSFVSVDFYTEAAVNDARPATTFGVS